MTAPDHLEPFTVRMAFRGSVSDPVDFTATLLTRVARSCQEAGASVIGHIKCHGRTDAGGFHCSLTSLRSGVRCSLDAGRPTEGIDLDMAVLVYGVDRVTVGELVAQAADTLCRAASVAWTADAASPHDPHEHSPSVPATPDLTAVAAQSSTEEPP